MNPFFTFIHSWLLGGLTYPALTFVITAAMKSTVIVLLTWCVTAFQRRKPALMRLWIWRACSVALLSVLLWALAPRFVDAWRMNVHVYPTPMISQALAQAQALDLLAKKTPVTQPVAEAAAPLIAYASAAQPEVPLATMRMPWMERIERMVFHAWWSVALLLLAWRALRAVCGHFWLRKNTAGILSTTGHRLVRGLVSPVVTGWRKACIWLPEAAAEWPAAKLRAVCLHEMAHYSRHDGAWQWLGWLTTSVWWWNPLAWLALRQLTSEAELSADESALSQHIAATDYAQMLVEIAAGGDVSTPAVGVAMLGQSSIQNRVKALLSGAGQHGVFGRKTKLALIVTALAGVMAAGVEVRHVMQAEKPSDPLTESEKILVERSLAVLKPQIEKLQRVHVRLTETWAAEGKETVRSPQPSVIEAWVDESARQSHAEYRPRVTQWTAGAAPWYIKDQTEATDGLRGWSYEGSESNEVRFSREPQDAFFSLWEARTRARELRDTLQQMLASGCKKFGLTKHVIREESDRVVIERHWPGGEQMEHWEMDLKQRGLALFRQHFPKRPEPFSVEWSVRNWAALDDGTPYPTRTDWKHHSSEGLDTYTRQITSLETISGIPAALLAPPQKEVSPYVATDGKAFHGEALETQFVHAATGKPVPEVKVHYEINGGMRQDAMSDPGGTLRIPLPPEEVKNLHFWGKKAGFVVQRVHWSRYGDPLKLPTSYTMKLYPAGKPVGGRVVNADGQPVAGAEVSIYHTGGPQRWNVFADVHVTSQTVKTAVDGRWSMEGYAGDLSGAMIRVEHPSYKRMAMDYRTATGQAYESLRDGSCQLVLHDESAEVSGLVTDETGKPVAGCAVTLGEDRHGHVDKPQAKTGTDGRYTVRTHEMGKDWITFEAPSLQPQTKQIEIVSGKAVRLDSHLTKGRVLQVQIVDETGRPVPSVWVVANQWQQKRPLWFEATTDAQGRFEWTGAPADEVRWEILKENTALRDYPLLPAAELQTVTLRPAIRFTGTVLDARTGQHVTSFKVTPGDTRRSANNIYWQNEQAQSFRDGSFTLEVWWMREDHTLRITAEGYEPFETALFTPKQQTESLTIKLVPKR